MNKQQLIVASIIADVLDVFVVGQIPVLSWFIDIPIIIMHVNFAGAKGFMTLIELVPVVGTLPLFTFAAFSHSAKE